MESVAGAKKIPVLLERLLNSSFNRYETRGVEITPVTYMFIGNMILVYSIVHDFIQMPVLSQEIRDCCPTLSYSYAYNNGILLEGSIFFRL